MDKRERKAKRKGDGSGDKEETGCSSKNTTFGQMSREFPDAESVDEDLRGTYTGDWVSRKNQRTLVSNCISEYEWIIASSKKTAPPSASPKSDGSGGREEAVSSGEETAPPSASPESDGSVGGKEAAASADDLEPAIILTRRCPPAEAYECGIHGKQWHPFSCEECKLVLELIRGPI
jgi:hypothetical protein